MLMIPRQRQSVQPEVNLEANFYLKLDIIRYKSINSVEIL